MICGRMVLNLVTWIKSRYNLKTFTLLAFFIYFQTKILYSVYTPFSLFYTDLIFNYLYAFALGVILVHEYKNFYKVIEFKIIFALLTWVFVLGIYNYSFHLPTVLNISFMTIVAFCIPFLLSDKEKHRMTMYTVAPTLVVLLVLAFFGVYAFLINSDVGPITPYMTHIDIHEDQSRLGIFFHPNLTAAIYSVAALVSIIFIFHVKNLFVRIIISTVFSMFCIIIALTQTRTAYFMFSVAFAVIISSVVLKKFQAEKNFKRFAKFAVVLILTAAIMFLTLSLVLNVFNGIRINLSSNDFSSYPFVIEQKNLEAKETELTTTGNAVVQTTQQQVNEVSATEFDFDVGRDYSDIVSFNGRTNIWADYIQLIKQYPSIILLGYRLDNWDISVEVQNITGNWRNHPHNGYFYLFLALGIFGLLLVLALFLFVAFRVVSCIIKGCALKNGFIVYGAVAFYIMATEMMESFFTDIYGIIPVTLFYCCGMICSCTSNPKINLKKILKK